MYTHLHLLINIYLYYTHIYGHQYFYICNYLHTCHNFGYTYSFLHIYIYIKFSTEYICPYMNSCTLVYSCVVCMSRHVWIIAVPF